MGGIQKGGEAANGGRGGEDCPGRGGRVGGGGGGDRGGEGEGRDGSGGVRRDAGAAAGGVGGGGAGAGGGDGPGGEGEGECGGGVCGGGVGAGDASEELSEVGEDHGGFLGVRGLRRLEELHLLRCESWGTTMVVAWFEGTDEK